MTTTNSAGYGGLQVPDIVGNIRYDQTRGSAQVMGAAHEVNAAYYGCSNVVSGNSGALVNCNFDIIGAPGTGLEGTVNTLPGSNGNGLSTTGHPGDEWGYALGAGLRLNFPMVARLLPSARTVYPGWLAISDAGH